MSETWKGSQVWVQIERGGKRDEKVRFIEAAEADALCDRLRTEAKSLRDELEAAQRRLTDAYGQLDTIHLETHCTDPSLETIQEQSAPDGECWDCDHPEGLTDAAREGK